MNKLLTPILTFLLVLQPTWMLRRQNSSWPAMPFYSGQIILLVANSCPSGFSEVQALNGAYLLGTVAANGDVGTTGGSNSYTPAGNNTAASFTGTQATLTGSVAAPTFTGSSATTSAVSGGTPSGTNAWPAGVPTFSGSSGTVPAETFTGSALGTHTHGAGTLADATSGSTVKLFTSSGSGVSAATLSGSTTAVSAGTPAGTNSTASFTPAGTVAWPAGVPTFSGSSLSTHTHTLTATGTNNAPALTMNAYTPAGTNGAAVFSGSPATIQPTFIKVIACQRS